MRISPRLPAFIYLVMAGLFFYSALKGSEDSADMFNFTTILLLLISTYMLAASIRLFKLYFVLKNHNKDKKK